MAVNRRVDRELLYKQVGERLKRERQRQNMTQSEVAESIGLLRTSITNIESGRQQPPLHVVYDLCATLNVDFEALVPPWGEVLEKSGKSQLLNGVSHAPDDVRRLVEELGRMTAPTGEGEDH